MAKKQAIRPETPTEKPQGAAPLPTLPKKESEVDTGLPNKALFRVDEVAQYFDVSERCIRLWIEHKLLIVEQYRERGTIRVTRESILSFRLKGKQEA